MSRLMEEAPTTLPEESQIGDTVSAMSILEPSALPHVELLGDQHEDRLPQHLALAVAEDPLGGGVPARHDAVERLAYDRVAGRGYDGGEAGSGALRLPPGAQVPHRAHDPERPARFVPGDEGALQNACVGVVGAAEAILVLPRLGAAR